MTARDSANRATLAMTLAAALLGLIAAPAQAQAPPGIPRNIMDVPKDAPPPRAVTPGRYKVVVEGDPSLPTHTIYRPADLAPFARGKLPIVVWGEGGCANVGRAFEGFLSQIASHGYLIVAVGPENAKMPDFAAIRPGGPPPNLGPMTRASQLIDGLDWALAQNARAAGPYAGKLNPKAVAAMGQSCGGLQAIAVSADPRIATSVFWNSGTFATQPFPGPPLGDASRDSLKAFHAPVAYIIGGPTDVAYPNAEADFGLIERVPVFVGNLNVGHGGTFRHPGGGWFADVGVAWLDWRLKGDRKAARMFAGPKCGLCVDPAWTVKKKNMD